MQRNKVYLQREFNCSVERLFEYLTKPELIAKWFGPNKLIVGEVESVLEVGGIYRIELIKPDHSKVIISGSYLEIEFPTKLKFGFEYIGLPNIPESTVIYNLESKGEVTHLTMVQEFAVDVPDFDTRTKAWEVMFERLEGVVKSL